MFRRVVSTSAQLIRRNLKTQFPSTATRGFASSDMSRCYLSPQSRGNSDSSMSSLLAAVGVAAGLFATATLKSHCDAENPAPSGHPAAALPTISIEELRKDRNGRVWVALDGGVYDVTPFMDAHPGGAERIMMTHGQDLSKFWSVYQLHDRPHIRGLLEEYRVGNLTPNDYLKVKSQTQFANAYTNDPIRPQGYTGQLRIPSYHPWNSEPADLSVLADNFYTPNDLFFVRNHNPVPLVEEKDWVLNIEANEKAGLKAGSFTLNDLKTKFPRSEVVATLQCAGNRQEDYVSEDRPLYVAPHWRNGAIGNAKWTGVRVRDILGYCGMEVDKISLRSKDPGCKIVNFIAMVSGDKPKCVALFHLMISFYVIIFSANNFFMICYKRIPMRREYHMPGLFL